MIVFTVVLGILLAGPPSAQADTEGAGDLVAMLMPAAVFAATWVQHDPPGRIAYGKGLAAAVAGATAMKAVIHRPRPDGDGDDSFPSRHAAVAFHSAAFLRQRYGLRYGMPAGLAAGFVAYSRVQAHRHNVGDVVAGALLGILCQRLFRLDDTAAGLAATPVAGPGGVGFVLAGRW